MSKFELGPNFELGRPKSDWELTCGIGSDQAKSAIGADLGRTGRTAQQYNRRKKRKGAFWEDHYHATAIQAGRHLAQCIVYIDLNMVRAGVVKHPSQWPRSRYVEIQNAPERYRLIDRKTLIRLPGVDDSEQLSILHLKWVEDALKIIEKLRERKWSESIAVGSSSCVEGVKAELGARAFGRKIVSGQGSHELRESQNSL